MAGYAPGATSEPSLSVIYAVMNRLVQQNALLVEQTADIQQRVAQLESRRGSRSQELSRSAYRRAVGGTFSAADADDTGSRWRCPVCLQPLLHAESFKGHVRKLLPSNVSTRPKCRLNPVNEHHVALLRRFAGANFEEKSVSFNQEFYNFVRNAVNSSYTADQSLELITSWLAAALATDDRSFPALPRVSSSDHHKRCRNEESSS
jgi:hypothetical protein